jgi:hypothetical protein
MIAVLCGAMVAGDEGAVLAKDFHQGVKGQIAGNGKPARKPVLNFRAGFS